MFGELILMLLWLLLLLLLRAHRAPSVQLFLFSYFSNANIVNFIATKAAMNVFHIVCLVFVSFFHPAVSRPVYSHVIMLEDYKCYCYRGCSPRTNG